MVVAIRDQLSTGALTVLCQARHLAYVLQPEAVLWNKKVLLFFLFFDKEFFLFILKQNLFLKFKNKQESLVTENLFALVNANLNNF